MSESDSLGREKHHYALSGSNSGLRAERQIYTRYRDLIVDDSDIIDGGFATAVYNACKSDVPAEASIRAMDLGVIAASNGERGE